MRGGKHRQTDGRRREETSPTLHKRGLSLLSVSPFFGETLQSVPSFLYNDTVEQEPLVLLYVGFWKAEGGTGSLSIIV